MKFIHILPYHWLLSPPKPCLRSVVLWRFSRKAVHIIVSGTILANLFFPELLDLTVALLLESVLAKAGEWEKMLVFMIKQCFLRKWKRTFLWFCTKQKPRAHIITSILPTHKRWWEYFLVILNMYMLCKLTCGKQKNGMCCFRWKNKITELEL